MTNQQAVDQILAMFRETDRQFKETALRFEETDRLNRARSDETELRFKETERLMKVRSDETDRKIKEVTASIGRLGNNLGGFVEERVRPAAVRLFRERGIDAHEVHRNVEAQRDGDAIEVDLLVVNDRDVAAIECKSTLGGDDVNTHLNRLVKLKKLLPSYAGKRVMGAVTGMVLPDSVAQYAYRQRLYVIAQTGDSLIIRNDGQFQPRVW